YDIPRAIVVEWHGQLYLFDCLYDHDFDDFECDYAVYRLPGELREELDQVSWTDLGHRGERVGAVATTSVGFDATRRETLNAAIFDQLGLR
ncbi:MAG: hypothetical protein ABIS21_00885, partial [Acidimicrobiales bacterium]